MESRANRPAIALEGDMDFEFLDVGDDPQRCCCVEMSGIRHYQTFLFLQHPTPGDDGRAGSSGLFLNAWVNQLFDIRVAGPRRRYCVKSRRPH
jgi:hypothetical protein